MGFAVSNHTMGSQVYCYDLIGKIADFCIRIFLLTSFMFGSDHTFNSFKTIQ